MQNEADAAKAVKELQQQIDLIEKGRQRVINSGEEGILLLPNEAKALIELWNFYQMYKPK